MSVEIRTVFCWRNKRLMIHNKNLHCYSQICLMYVSRLHSWTCINIEGAVRNFFTVSYHRMTIIYLWEVAQQYQWLSDYFAKCCNFSLSCLALQLRTCYGAKILRFGVWKYVLNCCFPPTLIFQVLIRRCCAVSKQQHFCSWQRTKIKLYYYYYYYYSVFHLSTLWCTFSVEWWSNES